MADTPDSDHRSIDARILDVYDTLTEGEQRLAEVVLETQGRLHSFTAGELAAKAQVSNATAARFFKHLGYKSYGQARLASRRSEAWGSPLYELASAAGHAQPSDLFQHLAQDIQNMSRTASLLGSDLVSEAIAILEAAPRIWVIGFRNSYVLANYARALLVHIKPDIRLLPIAGMTLAEDFVRLRPEDALFIVGFRRRPAVLHKLMEHANGVGAKSVLITDLTAARSARLATVALRCHTRSDTLFDSYAAPISVINHICAAVGLGREDESSANLAEIERLHHLVDPPDTATPSRSRRKG